MDRLAGTSFPNGGQQFFPNRAVMDFWFLGTWTTTIPI
jgi:hypothetical protein